MAVRGSRWRASRRPTKEDGVLADWLWLLAILFDEDFSAVQLFGGPGARLVTGLAGASALTLGEKILLSPASWAELEAGRRRALELVAHELVHVVQVRRYGLVRFLLRYVAEYGRMRLGGSDHRTAYLGLSAEREARRCAARCARLLAGRPVLGVGT